MTAGEITLSAHARWQAGRRELDEESVLAVARAPDQVIRVRDGREVRQSRRALPPDGKEYLIRVVVDLTAEEIPVITVYRTSKIDKSWRTR